MVQCQIPLNTKFLMHSYSLKHREGGEQKGGKRFKSHNDSARANADCCSKWAQSRSPDSPLSDLTDPLPKGDFLFVTQTGSDDHQHRNHRGQYLLRPANIDLLLTLIPQPTAPAAAVRGQLSWWFHLCDITTLILMKIMFPLQELSDNMIYVWYHEGERVCSQSTFSPNLKRWTVMNIWSLLYVSCSKVYWWWWLRFTHCGINGDIPKKWNYPKIIGAFLK